MARVVGRVIAKILGGVQRDYPLSALSGLTVDGMIYPVYIVGATAEVAVFAPAGTPQFGGDVRVSGVTANVSVYCPLGIPRIGTFAPGDFFVDPLQISGTAGSVIATVGTATMIAEPAVAGFAPTKTVWVRYDAPTGGNLTVRGVSTDNNYTMELFDGSYSMEDLIVSDFASYAAQTAPNKLSENAASMETSIVDWSAGGTVPPTLSQSSTRSFTGTKSLLITWGAGGTLPLAQVTGSGLTVGRQYTVSAWVWVPTGHPGARLVCVTIGSSTNVKDAWVKITHTFIATGTAHGLQVWPNVSPTAGQQCWVDEVQFREGPAPSLVLGEVASTVPAGATYARISDYNGTNVGDVVLEWFFDPLDTQMVLTISTPEIPETPANIRVGVLNAQPNETVIFSLVGVGPVFSEVADESGVLQGISVPIPQVAAGTHILTATGYLSSKTDKEQFQVLFETPDRPVVPGSDLPPVLVPQAGVRKWILQDLAPGGETYTFAINPARMTAPYAPKVITPEVTTAPDGQAILWQGARRAHQWEFEGILTTAAQYDAMVRFLELGRRFYLIDHKNRAWVVTFESFDPQHFGPQGSLYNYKYNISALIYSGPTAVV